MDYKLFWSDEAQDNLRGIISYLESEWSEKEFVSFKEKLSKQLNLIAKNPRIFPVSEVQLRLLKAVLSKHTTIFYEVKGYEIHLAYLFSNRMILKVLNEIIDEKNSHSCCHLYSSNIK